MLSAVAVYDVPSMLETSQKKDEKRIGKVDRMVKLCRVAYIFTYIASMVAGATRFTEITQ